MQVLKKRGFYKIKHGQRQLREKAKIEGKLKYTSTKLCKYGHSERYTRNSHCVICHSMDTLKQQYGITEAKYNKMLWLQNGVCAICRKEETIVDERTGKLRRLAVDHCHNTNKVRGLLCNSCNTGIGKLQHDPELLRIAALYCEL